MTNRRHERVAFELDLRMHFDTFETAVETTTLDVSHSGLFVAVKPSPAVGTKVHFTLAIGDPPEVIALEGRVVRLGEHRARLGLQPLVPAVGIGVELTKRPAVWDAFVDDLREARARQGRSDAG